MSPEPRLFVVILVAALTSSSSALADDPFASRDGLARVEIADREQRLYSVLHREFRDVRSVLRASGSL